jgi:hypothetical protein
MHYRMLVAFSKEMAETSEEARSYVFETLIADSSFIGGGRFGAAYCDWFVVGGRWSGELSRATWARDVQQQIDDLEKEAGIQVWGTHYGDEETRRRWEDLSARIEALYAQAVPEEYRGKGLVFARDAYKDHGYEDDAMIVTEALYEAFLKKYEGEDLVMDITGGAFVDLDYDPVNRDFIGHKWLVVIDAHS